MMLFILAFVQITSVYAQEGVFEIDLERSSIHFEISHLGVLKVNGSLEEFSGTFNVIDEKISSISCEIEVASIDTDNEERDRILLTEPYFFIEKFPKIRFHSKEITEVNGITELIGELDIKGVANPIQFPCQLEFSKDRASFSLNAEIRIKRSDYNLTFGSMNGLIGQKVDITLSIIATK